MDDARLVIFADPAPWPSRFHVVDPFSIAQRPCWAMPAITMSRSGLAEMRVMLPHSEVNPARFPVATTHGAEVVGDVGEVGDVGDVDAEGVETHKAIPHDVVLGSVEIVPGVAKFGLFFCPQPALARTPSATVRTTSLRRKPTDIYQKPITNVGL